MLLMILFVVIGLIVCALIMLPFAAPELFTRFSKSLFRSIKRALRKPTLTPEQEAAKAKAKKLAPYTALATKIEQIVPGQILRFKVPETWGGNFITVELNSQEPQTGKKYILSMENAVNGMPGQRKTLMYVTDKTMEIATSIIERNGELFVMPGEKTISTEKVKVA